ncbi:MAG TPA: sulfite exporter TauE/SafE family protein [Bacteroidota bacterium]|nr:sulfite exporter TauE/SafE family protein [Bacteroidota bacterium]
MTNNILYILLGLLAGTFSGLIGVGGGIIIVPCLVIFFGLTQHQAQGTTLALMVPPIGMLAAWNYYTHGFVDLRIAAFVCVGFLFGGLFGAKIATSVSNELLGRIFGVVLILVGLKMVLGK